MRWEDGKFRLNKLGYIEVKHKRDIDGKIKEDGTICVAKSALIRYFLDNSIFLPLDKAALNQIDGLLKTKEGKPISSQDLSNETSQLQKRGKILREERDSGKIFKSKH